jgi:hypothetical protein
MTNCARLWPALLLSAGVGCAKAEYAPPQESAVPASPTAGAPASEMAPAEKAMAPMAAARGLFGASANALSSDEGGAGGSGGKGGRERRRNTPTPTDKPRSEARGGKDGTATPTVDAKPKRLVHYNGNLRLKVTNASDVLSHAAKVCEEAGGYVETLTIDTVILRVPVVQFRPLFAKLLGLGEIMSRSITAQDVTDAFTAMDLRLRILKASRDRLVALLPKATTARAKLDLLSEIRRLTEEIDQLDRYLTQIQSLAQFSRISLNVEVKQVQVETRAQEPIAAFKWIHDLSPFKQGVAERNSWLELQAPQGMAVVDDSDTWFVDDCWHAESPDGAKLWASQNDLGPAGSTDFWIDAVKARLGPEYVAAEVTTVGKFKVLRLLDENSDNGYRYLVAVKADHDKLQVVEAYFANAEQEKRYGAVVRAAIERGDS